MEQANEKKWSVLDGLFRHNPVFAAGMSIAPAVIIGNTLDGALTYAVFFSALTFTALLISSFLPRKIPYALRIILYTVIAAVVYIPLYAHLDGKLPEELIQLGVFLPMITTGEFIVSASELRFFRMKRGQMAADVAAHIIGFDIAVILLGIIREVGATGGINGAVYGISSFSPLLSAPCGGFVLIGFIGAFIRLFVKK